MRVLLACICSFAAACSFRPEIIPAKGTTYATARSKGITLIADASAWEGYPRDFEDLATPIAVEIHNESAEPVRVSLANVSLTTDTGQVFTAWRVEDEPPKVQQPASQPAAPAPQAPAPKTDADVVEGINTNDEATLVPALYVPGEMDFVVEARGGRGGIGRGGALGRGGGWGWRPPVSTFRPGPARPPIYRGPSGYRGPGVYRHPGGFYRAPRIYIGPGFGFYGGYYAPFYNSPWWGGGFGYGYGFNYAYPDTAPIVRDDVGRLALRDTTLDPGTRTSGFVYFQRATDDAQSLTLKVAVTRAASTESATELKTVFFVRR
jgi:hypothetical protein